MAMFSGPGKSRWLPIAPALIVMVAVALPAMAEQASLAWDASADASVMGYYVYYGPASRAYTSKVDAGYQTNHTALNLTKGQTYFFAVTAYDAARIESAYSNEVETTMPPLPTAQVVEFYNAHLDHYFISSSAREIGDLDDGVYVGWARTGLSFNAFGAGGNGANPVCRFYIPPAHGDSHFFSAFASECALALQKMENDPNFIGYVYESPNVFYVGLPDTVSGACAEGMVKVYRIWNNRSDSNHRYTTYPAVRSQMVAKGYVAEGYGPDAVAMCAPQ